MSGKIHRDVLDPFRKRPFLREQQSICATNIMNFFTQKSAPLQPDHIESSQVSPITNCDPVGYNVVLNTREPTDERVRPYPAKLMNRSPTSKNSIVTNLTMPC